MPARRYVEIDVFTDRPLFGNPLAVIADAAGLDTPTMQRIAAWTNFSETAFLLPPSSPEADYRVRIFTPFQELPFAGHPSVGSAFTAIACGLVDDASATLVQECAAGLLPVHVESKGPERVIRVQAPAARIDRVDATRADALTVALGAPLAREPYSVCNGPTWLTCDLGEATRVRGLQPDMASIAALCLETGAVGVGVFGHEAGGEAALAVRAFCPADGIPEDPVTGSANAAIAALLHALDGLGTLGRRYTASQGREIGRDGIVDVSVDEDGTVAIGGRCVIVVEGSLTL